MFFIYNTSMKKTISLLAPFTFLLLLGGCGKPDHHPKNPNYHIIKPSVKYAPSVENLGKMVKQLQGSPYVWAEEGPNNFDCSGFTYYLYGSMGIEIPRVARHQAREGKKINVDSLRYGDLIFFATSRRSRKKITHVGMYLGDGWFTHASTVDHEIIYSNLFKSEYYKDKLRGCRRYLPDEVFQDPTREIWDAQPEDKDEDTDTLKPLPSLPLNSNDGTKKAIVIQAPLDKLERGSAEGTYYIQIGSFTGRPSYQMLLNIKNNGFTHEIIQFKRGTKTISKLLVGPYTTRTKASTALETIKSKIKKDAFIAEIR
jgi:hypothetical protein